MAKWLLATLVIVEIVLVGGSVWATSRYFKDRLPGTGEAPTAATADKCSVPKAAVSQGCSAECYQKLPISVKRRAPRMVQTAALPDGGPAVRPPVGGAWHEPARDTLCVMEDQTIRVDMNDPTAMPAVGKHFNMAMHADPQAADMSDGQLQDRTLGVRGTTGGAFDCHIKDQLPKGFTLPDPMPPLTALYLRRRGYPVQAEWALSGTYYRPEFDLVKIPRHTCPRSLSEGAQLEYEGFAPIEVPPCFTSELTVTPSEIRAGRITEVTLTLALDRDERNSRRGQMIRIEGVIPAKVGEATIAVERPDPLYIKTLTHPCENDPYYIYGSAVALALPPNFIPDLGHMRPRPDQDPRLGGVPAKIEFKLHVHSPTRGPIRLKHALWCWQLINGTVLPTGTASSPQAKDVRYRASASVERFHNVTIMVK